MNGDCSLDLIGQTTMQQNAFSPRLPLFKHSLTRNFDPGNIAGTDSGQYETLAGTMGLASNGAVDRHRHKGSE